MARKKRLKPFRLFIAGLIVGAVGSAAAMIAAPADLRAQIPLTLPGDVASSAPHSDARLGNVEVYFSPRGGATDAIVREIAAAQEHVRVQAYSFTSAPIARALVQAHQRGVKVTAVLDKSQRSERYSSATFLHNHGAAVLIDEKHAIAHNKIILIDRRTIITGSFNFSKAAEERNAENLLIIRDEPDMMRLYQENFRAHATHAQPYRR